MKKPSPVLASQSISAADDLCSNLATEIDSVSSDHHVDQNASADGLVQIGDYVFYENWDEIDPPGSDDEPGIPHEVVVAKIWAMLKKPVDRERAGDSA